ncbi:hypothetical protein TSOC_006169 [Tetrabaena socialis]|uniref:Uncharacterized protein n=1 Tax=Tetrabaena socialis TaxID=47790 RepID=A0A2J8A4B9_9CHLO|nr:hypothetical protein TSOC_006169 [Tetrabaena socialis]|eukprot:PNH07382.1 hypothetical protein TSOC_006169 [Tetrabaena socialis]
MLSLLATPMARPSVLPTPVSRICGLSARQFPIPRAAASATLTEPIDQDVETHSHSNIVAFPREASVAPLKPAVAQDSLEGPASSGHDFVDLIGLDDSTVLSRLQDAVTYRVLVGGASSPTREGVPLAAAGAFNLKQLKSYRDNVTRNCAPTVARGFAAAAKSAGHVLGQRSTSPQTPQQAQQSRSQQQAQQPPPQQSLRQRLLAEQQQRRPGTPAATLALTAHSHHRSKQQQGQQQQALSNPAAQVHADGRASVLFAIPRPITSARSRAAAVAAETQWALPPSQPTPAAAAAVAASSAAADKSVAADEVLGAELRQVAAAAALRAAACPEASAVVARRRRGSRGAGQAAVASAGRQPGSAGAAWI